MGLIGKAVKAGLAKKAFTEARKPHNQAKIKSMISSFTNKSGKSGTTTRRPR